MRQMTMKRVLWLAAAVVSLTGCNLDVAAPGGGNLEPSDPAKETFDASLKVDIPNMTKTAAGTYYKDFKVGTGTALTSNTVIVYSYVGFLKGGSTFGTVFQQTIVFGSLLGGLQDGMMGMKVGGERLIVVPSALGFGSVPLPGVPPNSTLVYDVILDGIP
jgi:FKBP-type peptidyl-prolyl cis-trans isomerase